MKFILAAVLVVVSVLLLQALCNIEIPAMGLNVNTANMLSQIEG